MGFWVLQGKNTQKKRTIARDKYALKKFGKKKMGACKENNNED